MIQMQGNMLTVSAGQVCSGIIHIQLNQPFPGTMLMLTLKGCERTFMRKRHSKTVGSGKRRRRKYYYRNHVGFFPMINADFPIFQFPDGPPRPGQYSFPFSILIPDWLPASMHVVSEYERARLGVEYYLVAQLQPDGDISYWADDNQSMSSFYTSVPIYLMRPMIQTGKLLVDEANELNSDIGGCCGGCTTPSRSKIYFQKNQYYPGEIATGRIVCDNSECDKDISYFLMKLQRRTYGNSSDGYSTEIK